MADLVEGLGHENFAFELGVHGDEWCTVQFLESADQDDLDVLNIQHVEVPQVIPRRIAINKALTIQSLVQSGALLLENFLVCGLLFHIGRLFRRRRKIILHRFLLDLFCTAEGNFIFLVVTVDLRVLRFEELVELGEFLRLLLPFEILRRQFCLFLDRVVLEFEVRGQVLQQRALTEDVAVENYSVGDFEEVAVPIGRVLIHAT